MPRDGYAGSDRHRLADARTLDRPEGARCLTLPPKAFTVLRYLLEHPGRIVTKDELLRAAWPGVVVSDWAVRTCLREIREALGDGALAPRYIETVHRRGYRFAARSRLPTMHPERR